MAVAAEMKDIWEVAMMAAATEVRAKVELAVIALVTKNRTPPPNTKLKWQNKQ